MLIEELLFSLIEFLFYLIIFGCKKLGSSLIVCLVWFKIFVDIEFLCVRIFIVLFLLKYIKCVRKIVIMVVLLSWCDRL